MTHIRIGRATALFGAAATFLTGLVPAQDKPKVKSFPAAKMTRPKPMGEVSQSELIRRRAKKLTKPVFAMAPWHLDYDEARAAAAASNKLLLVYFTRSYAP